MAATVTKIRKVESMAGQTHYVATVVYDGEAPYYVGFVGSEMYGGPVIMIDGRGNQTFVTDPGRFGSFGREWVRRFFTD